MHVQVLMTVHMYRVQKRKSAVTETGTRLEPARFRHHPVSSPLQHQAAGAHAGMHGFLFYMSTRISSRVFLLVQQVLLLTEPCLQPFTKDFYSGHQLFKMLNNKVVVLVL